LNQTARVLPSVLTTGDARSCATRAMKVRGVGGGCTVFSILHSNDMCTDGDELCCCPFSSDPVCIDTLMSVVSIQWNHCGSVLAVAGSLRASHLEKEINVVQFYTPFGEVRGKILFPDMEFGATTKKTRQ